MPKAFVPKVTHTKHLVSGPVLEWAQAKANEAYEKFRQGENFLDTAVTEVCAVNRAVPPHVDAEQKDGLDMTGMRIFGLVIKSDGHRLHSDALEKSGRIEGIRLSAGDVYEIDAFDRHWTSIPFGAEKAELIFTVSIMRPDGRSHTKLGHDFKWTVLAASVQDMKRARAA